MKYLILLPFAFMIHLSGAQSVNHESPLVVFVVGDHEYSSEETMPILANEIKERYGLRVKVLKSFPDHTSEENIPGLEALQQADLAVFFLRWRRLPVEQIDEIDKYLKSGKPIIGFRTSTHAFNYPTGHPLEVWNSFGEFALGAPPGWEGEANHIHCGHTCSTDVHVVDSLKTHPILNGVDPSFHVSSWLYKVLPHYPVKGSTSLLMGKAVNSERENFADNPVAWTCKNSYGAKVFTTTMGHPDDFEVTAFQRLLVNAIHWTLGLPSPKNFKKKMKFDVQYRGL